MEELVIHKMRAEEVPLVHELEAACFSDPWSESSLKDMSADTCTLYVTAFLGKQLAGYCGVRTVLDEGDILRIAVREEFRGKGIGTALLRTVEEKTPQIRNWNLDVRETNTAAIALYRKFGFGTIGKRKRYYHHPDEDAILMQRIR